MKDLKKKEFAYICIWVFLQNDQVLPGIEIRMSPEDITAQELAREIWQSAQVRFKEDMRASFTNVRISFALKDGDLSKVPDLEKQKIQMLIKYAHSELEKLYQALGKTTHA